MRTIAIVLGDNDFGNTFRNLLRGLTRIFLYRAGETMTREDVELIIRRSIMAYYVGFQYSFEPRRYSAESHEAHLAHIEQYLSGIKVLFDEEAEADITIRDHDGGAWYLEIQSGTIASY